MNRYAKLAGLQSIFLGSGVALAQMSSFTYQGQLKQQGFPLSDLVDMRFTLFDSDTAEMAIAGPLVFDGLSLAAIQVTNGLFAVELDFGVEALQKGGQWLLIEVRAPHDPSNAGPYTSMSPRQKLTATPFALSVPGLATTQAGVEVDGDVHALGEVAASAYTSNSPFIIKVNPLQIECARFEDQQCYLGLGTPAPQARLHVGGVAGVDGIMFPDGSLQTTAASGGGGGVGGSGTPNSIPFWSSGTTLGSSQITQNANGVQLPNGVQLAVGAQANGLSFGSPNGETGLTIAGPTGRADLRFGTFNSAESILKLVVRGAGSGPPAETNGISITTAGKVGIGTTAPASKLDIDAKGDGAELLRFATDRPWVFRQIRAGPSAGLQLLSTSGLKKFEITANDGANVVTFLADSGNSKVGIGTTDPTSRLEIAGQDGLRITGFEPFLTLTDSKVGGPYHARIQNANGNMVFYTDSSLVTGIPALSVLNSGRVKVNTLEIAGADVAEKFPSEDKNVEPGTVMEIDPDNSGKLRISQEAYCTRVAGVVSGAGNIPVGAVLGNLPGHEDAPAIALSGRIWVRCDASTEAIIAGDLLTTSSAPGHAMKASDRVRSHGAVLGKAMTTLPQGERDLVLVLVNLQ